MPKEFDSNTPARDNGKFRQSESQSFLNENTLSYNGKIKSHHLNVVLGQSFQQDRTEAIVLNGNGYIEDVYKRQDAGRDFTILVSISFSNFTTAYLSCTKAGNLTVLHSYVPSAAGIRSVSYTHLDVYKRQTYYRGNLKSEVSVIIISDFDCESCINAHSLYNSIYEEYKDKVKFGYIHYSAMPTFAEIASDAANKQNRFWEFQDSLYAYRGYIDSTAVFKIAHNMSMDINKFQNDIANDDGKKAIENTINQLVLLGVYATPTLIINGRLIVDSNSKEEICHLIDEELSK